MSDHTWPRLKEILAALSPEDLARVVANLPPPGPPHTAPSEIDLADDRLIRQAIRALSDRAARALGHLLAAGGRLHPGPATAGEHSPGIRSLLAGGLLLPYAGSFAVPLEFALAGGELLPEESLLRLLGQSREEELRAWYRRLCALTGIPENSCPAFLLCAAEVFSLLTARLPELLARLSPSARAAIAAFGPADGLLRRQTYLSRFDPSPIPAETFISPLHPPAEAGPVTRELLVLGLLAGSGSAWQPGIYLHIPAELRSIALRPYYEALEEQAAVLIAQAAGRNHSPTGPRQQVAGQMLLAQIVALLACLRPRLTGRGSLAQNDLEKMAGLLQIGTHHAELLVQLALGLGLAHLTVEEVMEQATEQWPSYPLPGRRALSRLAGLPRRDPGAPDRDFISLLRLGLLERLSLTESWLTPEEVLTLAMTQPGLGRWREYYWGGEPPEPAMQAAIATEIETLGQLGAVAVESVPPHGFRLARILPFGRELAKREFRAEWPVPSPIVLTASFEIYAPLGNGPGVLGRLARLAELTAAGPSFVFNLSRESLLRAAAAGLDLTAEEAWLASHVPGGLPQNVAEHWTEIAGRQGEVSLGQAGGYIKAKDQATHAAAKRAAAAANQIVLAESSDLLVLAPGADLPRLVRELQRAGVLVEQTALKTAASLTTPRKGRSKR